MKTSRTPIELAVIGHPIRHTLSPRIFELIGGALGREIRYGAVDVPPARLKGFLAKPGGLAGVNVTIPHKEKAAALMGSLTPEARAIGAVNAVRFSGAKSKGHNTDADGFLDALADLGLSARGRDAVIFGAGGAARAVAFALAREGAGAVRLVNRTAARADAIARAMGSRFSGVEFSAGEARPAELWINATPLGMEGFEGRSPAPRRFECGAAFDLVYSRTTPFLRQAAKAGVRASDGLSMLVFQALRAWEFWTGPLDASERRGLAHDVLKEL
jgi:shikimate dehydrogenase